jgi:hypothetical protein
MIKTLQKIIKITCGKKEKIMQNKRFYILIPFLEMSKIKKNTYKYTAMYNNLPVCYI